MAIRTQLTVFLENKSGVLARMTESFVQHDISIEAIMVSDSTDMSFIRMVVNDPEKAREILEERGALVVESSVLVITIPDKPGMLADIAGRLHEKGININYVYGSGPVSSGSVQMVLNVDDLHATEETLGF